MKRTLPSCLALVVAATCAQAQVLDDGRLVYPEGGFVPRSLTPMEREFQESNRNGGQRAVTPPPDGPVWCPGEYEPMEGLLIAWEGWDASINTILAQIAKNVTDPAKGNGIIYVVVDNASDQTNATTRLQQEGVDMARVRFVTRTTDTIWIRDYGPRYIYLGDCRAIVDHDYNRPRPNDDAFPSFFKTFKKHDYYEHDLVHGGGNFHLDSLGRSYVTRLINNENPGKTEAQIDQVWSDYQNVDTTFFTPYPQSVDSTQHIDMWMQVIADNAVVISDWPNNPGSTQDQICDNAAIDMAAAGYTVTRVPARSVGGVHYTYTNVVMFNNVVMIPSYTNGSVTQHNAPALAAWQAALPSKTIVQFNCEAIVSAAGVIHCIVMHVPTPLGGLDPTAYLKTVRGGESLDPGDVVEIKWITDDDVGAINVDLLLSTDGGATFPTVIAAATTDDGTFNWTVPDVLTTTARVRVVARDADARTGFDDSDSDFTINGTPPTCPADMDGNGVLNIFDFLVYQTYFSEGDLRADVAPPFGTLNVFDFLAFQTLFGEGC